MSRKIKPQAAFIKDVKKMLAQYPHGISVSALSSKMGKERHMIQNALNHLVKHRNAIKVSSKYFGGITKDMRVTGLFRRKYSGAGTVISQSGEVQINRRQGYALVDGDEIEAISVVTRQGVRAGKVSSLLKRRTTPVIGYYKSDSRGKRVYPLDSRVSAPIIITGNHPKSANGKVVAVTLEPHFYNTAPQGRIERILGKRYDYGVQTEIFAAKFHLRDSMPKNVIEEANTLVQYASEKDMSSRVNMTDMATVTVDPDDARDFDDALSLDATEKGFKLYVHIADVAHYVPQNSKVDHEAFLRGTSVYLPERAIHMLPELLATTICSLTPNQNRLAVTVMIDFDGKGNILNSDIMETVIRSDVRLTYQDFLRESDPDVSQSNVSAETRQLCVRLRHLCHLLIQQRIKRGVLDLDMPETAFSYDEKGKVNGIHKKNRSIAEQTIEEFMIAANIVVAEFLDHNHIPHIRRVHDAPDPSEIADLKISLRQLGLKAPQNPLNPDEVREFLSSIDNSAIRSVASQRILRSMKRAVYSAKRSGHFGLALNLYTQFTSPIRRYPDLLVHRSVKSALNRHKSSLFNTETLEAKAKLLSDCERRAQEAEWEAVKIEKIRFMQSKIGNVYSGTITHVLEFGAFVELDEPFVEGFIPVSRMESFFYYDESSNCLTNQDKSIILKPGASVKVQVETADADRGTLDFTIV